MSAVEHEVMWWEVEENWCVLDANRNTWWVTAKRRRDDLGVGKLEFMLDNGQGVRAPVAKDAGERVTIVMFDFDDRIALINEIFRRRGLQLTAVRGAQEVDDGPDTMARRVSG